ncbi:MAG: hypothetical protein M1818_007258 [Claussenomyces sp. TS43310]|nr:MAG: hypothetical protein M1818_007258 [Claussenomyces sp. TS43310]
MQPASIVDGWLEDVHREGIHACEVKRAATTTSQLELQQPSRKRRACSMQHIPSSQKRPKQIVDPQAVDSVETPRVLRSRSHTKPIATEQESSYTTSINNATASTLAKLTRATTLSQPSTWSGSKSPTRARSRSPAKTVDDLENADPPTVYLQMRHPDNELPPKVRDLNNNVMRASRRQRGLLPGIIKPLLIPHLDDCDAEDDDLFDDLADEGARDVFKDILHIHTKALNCFESDKPEASWGEEVVRPLLDLAASRTKGRIIIENVTSTIIQPLTLIPRGSGIEGLPYEGKRVDYGLFIAPTKDEVRQIKERLKKLPDGEVWSINQTEAYYLREKPLLSSIELKLTRSNHDPLLQLAIWNSAMFQRLEGLFDLTGQGDFMLPIPSLAVSGHNWQVCYSYVGENGRSRILRGMVDIGSTIDIVGMYRILRALDVIASYGANEYWPWLSGCLFS